MNMGFPHPAETGVTENGIPLNRVSMLLGPVMEKLLGEVRVSIDFYMSEFQVSRVDKDYYVWWEFRFEWFKRVS